MTGTSDDQNLTAYGIPNSQTREFPDHHVVGNAPDNGAYKTVEFR